MAVISMNKINLTLGNKKILSDFNMEVEKSEFLCIYGKSGAGKSTILNIIGQLQKVDSGTIFINNELMKGSINKCSKKFLRNEITYLFQELALLDSETVRFNLELSTQYKNLDDKSLSFINALDQVGLDMSYLDRKVFILSGGEKQRVAIAKVILKNTPLLIADEPTATLDEENSIIIFELMKKLNQAGTTIIAVTHDLKMKEYATRSIEIV